jgi:hypothetical protein
LATRAPDLPAGGHEEDRTVIIERDRIRQSNYCHLPLPILSLPITRAGAWAQRAEYPVPLACRCAGIAADERVLRLIRLGVKMRSVSGPRLL